MTQDGSVKIVGTRGRESNEYIAIMKVWESRGNTIYSHFSAAGMPVNINLHTAFFHCLEFYERSLSTREPVNLSGSSWDYCASF